MKIPLRTVKIAVTEGLEAWQGGEWRNAYIPLAYLAKKAGGPTKLLKTFFKIGVGGGAVCGVVIGAAGSIITAKIVKKRVARMKNY